MLNSIAQVSKKLNITKTQIKVVLNLLQEGSTVPFISRYRKAQTNGLDEEQIENINNEYKYTLYLNKRKESIIEILQESKLLTDVLKNEILNATKKSVLEELYAPYKEGKKTKATKAIALGLEPFAKNILHTKNENFDLKKEAKKFLTKEVKTIDFILEQTKFIISQHISQNIKARKIVKEQIKKFGFVVSKGKKMEEDDKQKFKQYYEYKEKITSIPNHRIMSLNRGEKLKILSVDISFDDYNVINHLFNFFKKPKRIEAYLHEAILDAFKRLILPSVKRELRRELFEKAEKSSIKLFANNLEEMLLAPAVKGKIILAIDPAFLSGCKIAVLSDTGDVLDISLIKATPPHNKIVESEKIINQLIDKYKVDIIVIGNGTASRETEQFISNVLKKRKDSILFTIVSEVGASVYSSSDIAIKEFPNLLVEQRSAINIGRRFQDPLNELIKINPKFIGVGQYQHDVNQKDLANNLEFKVNKVVNMVGVDVNTATSHILSYIAGINKKTSENIVKYRKENGPYKNRKELKKVKGFGSKAYEQAIGFIRIHDSNIFYDKTHIHPKSYELADKFIKIIDLNLSNIDSEKLLSIDRNKIANDLNSNKYDIDIIVDSLLAPEKDIRENREGPLLKLEILKIEDLSIGMQLEGTIQNITDFGAFVYIGLKQTALIHISNISDKYISHPSDILKTNKKVLIEIIGIEIKRERIQAKLIS